MVVVFEVVFIGGIILLLDFSADVGVLQEFLVRQFNVRVPRLDPVLVRDKCKVSNKFIGSMICHLGIVYECTGDKC